MKKFMYYTTRENNNLIAVNPFIVNGSENCHIFSVANEWS